MLQNDAQCKQHFISWLLLKHDFPHKETPANITSLYMMYECSLCGPFSWACSIIAEGIFRQEAEGKIYIILHNCSSEYEGETETIWK